jgi:hypothetical protein
MLGRGIFPSDGVVGWEIGREERKSSLESPARMISARRLLRRQIYGAKRGRRHDQAIALSTQAPAREYCDFYS